MPYLNISTSYQIDKSPKWYFWFNTVLLCPTVYWLHTQYFYYYIGFYIKINCPGPVLFPSLILVSLLFVEILLMSLKIISICHQLWVRTDSCSVRAPVVVFRGISSFLLHQDLKNIPIPPVQGRDTRLFD